MGRGRTQTPGEELANSVSHGAGAVLAIAAIPVLVVDAVAGGGPWVEVFAVTVFGVAMVVLYSASALYHALPADLPWSPRSGRAKRLFWYLDHSAIYLLIAGTYTPFALGVFIDSWGWAMFALVWSLAGAGVLLKCVGRGGHPAISAGLYLAMGWLVLGALEPLLTDLPRAGLVWLVAGGLAYTVGVLFFLLDARVRYGHFVWHLFVLAGTACHFVAVLRYA